mgnify:CR=1 FL=1
MANVSGPLFDGRAEKAVSMMCDDIEAEVADRGLHLVQSRLNIVLQNPTGRYESGINVEGTGAGDVVNDGDIIYGPWLEGTGSRNRTTRFKGYSTFRQVRDVLDSQAEQVAETVVPRYVRLMD